MTHKAKSKPATAITSSSKLKDISLPQLSALNATTLSVLHVYCKLLFSVCQKIWLHLKEKSSPFTNVPALVNFVPAMKTPLVSLNKYCGSQFTITISDDLYSSFPSKSQFYFWKHTLGLKPLDSSAHFPSKEDILAKYDKEEKASSLEN
ncbi:hypothetical protein Moror_15558 [Moniliophthora roreri MCA 2997]|uniref:Uncharacterized protein n=1 Tax=Moniliophthora roreri (strain MCA 2997) TaxID=1381753 RepID=V2W1B7_MONRO|nr:hypothetical protein Moror_15558 [Moniliophthora roreri MCA 2997]